MAGEQTELAQDVSETREKVWSNDDYRTLRDNSVDPPPAPRKQPDAAPAESAGQGRATS